MSMSARTLVLLPGLMCDEAVWAPSLSGLPDGWEPWVADYGLCNSLQSMAEAVLAGAPQGPFALAGHSMGGRVALEVVRLAPQRVSHLALLDTGHTPRAAGEAGAEEARKRYALLEMARTQGVRSMAQTWVQGMVAPDRLMDAELIERIVAMFARKVPRCLRPRSKPCCTGRMPRRCFAALPCRPCCNVARKTRGPRLRSMKPCAHWRPMPCWMWWPMPATWRPWSVPKPWRQAWCAGSSASWPYEHARCVGVARRVL